MRSIVALQGLTMEVLVRVSGFGVTAFIVFPTSGISCHESVFILSASQPTVTENSRFVLKERDYFNFK